MQSGQFMKEESLTATMRMMEWRVTSIHGEALKPMGLNMYLAMSLIYISRHGFSRSVNQRSVESYLYLSNPGVSKIVGFLEREGYVTRDPDPSDARSYLLHATAKGMEFAGKLDAVIQEADRQILSPLTSREQETLLGLLQKIGKE